jgi:hypothetical protein
MRRSAATVEFLAAAANGLKFMEKIPFTRGRLHIIVTSRA